MAEPKGGVLRRDNRRMLGKLAVVTAMMFGFGYALVPLYRHICEALGINVLSLSERVGAGGGAPTRPANTQIDRSRVVTVAIAALPCPGPSQPSPTLAMYCPAAPALVNALAHATAAAPDARSSEAGKM